MGGRVNSDLLREGFCELLAWLFGAVVDFWRFLVFLWLVAVFLILVVAWFLFELALIVAVFGSPLWLWLWLT